MWRAHCFAEAASALQDLALFHGNVPRSQTTRECLSSTATLCPSQPLNRESRNHVLTQLIGNTRVQLRHANRASAFLTAEVHMFPFASRQAWFQLGALISKVLRLHEAYIARCSGRTLLQQRLPTQDANVVIACQRIAPKTSTQSDAPHACVNHFESQKHFWLPKKLF